MKAIIFDLDGVIIDSEEQWFQVTKDLCAEYGYEYTKELYKKVMGSNGPRIIKEKLNLSDSEDELKDKLKRNYLSLIKDNIKIMPGIHSLLERAGKGFVLALASSSPQDVIDFVIDKTKLGDYFSFSTCGSEVENAKPEPEIFLLTAEKMELKPTECIVVEDSPNGVRAAKAAGMKCIALKNPYASGNELKKAGADIIINDLDEITEKLLKDLS